MKHLFHHTSNLYTYTLGCQEYLDRKSLKMELLIFLKFRLVITLQFVLTDLEGLLANILQGLRQQGKHTWSLFMQAPQR